MEKDMTVIHGPIGMSEKGNVTVIALMILGVLTLLGVIATRTSSMDIQIAANQIPYKQNFYIADGGGTREAAEVGRGNYPVMNVATPHQRLATQAGQSDGSVLPGDEADHIHRVAGTPYDFTLDYEGYFLPPQGYSVVHFSRYDYSVDAARDLTGGTPAIDSRYYKIGPKAE